MNSPQVSPPRQALAPPISTAWQTAQAISAPRVGFSVPPVLCAASHAAFQAANRARLCLGLEQPAELVAGKACAQEVVELRVAGFIWRYKAVPHRKVEHDQRRVGFLPYGGGGRRKKICKGGGIREPSAKVSDVVRLLRLAGSQLRTKV